MKKIISTILTTFLVLSLVGCGSNSSQYTESEFIGVWMTEKSIEGLKQMSDFHKNNLQSSISSMRICEDNVVIYTPTNQGSVAMNSYKLKGKELVVTSTTLGNYRSDGKTVSEKTSYKIVSVNNEFQLDLNGTRYIKVCDNPYEYDIADFLE